MDLEQPTPIRLAIRVPVGLDLAWAYLTEPEHVAEWLTAASPIGAVGEPYVLDFGEGSAVHGEIVELVPGERFAHRWAWLDSEPRQETLVTWSIRPLDGGGVEIELIHDGWLEAGADATIRDDHEAYWSGYLDDLRDLLEDVARP